MEKRLNLAKNLLRNNGVIFISIDDNEGAQLKLLCDEVFGSWGFQGTETACKMWLSGGKVVTNTDVLYGHMFRTENIPYERKMEDVLKAQIYAKEQFIDGKFKGTRSLSWLVEKFNPPGWSEEMLEFIHRNSVDTQNMVL